MITFRTLPIYPDPVHCCCQELVTTSHEYACTTAGDFLRHSDRNDFLTNSSLSQWKPPSPALASSCNIYQVLDPHLIDRPIYPSPPSTSSQPGRTVPLPNDWCQNRGSERTPECQSDLGGIIDSPLVVEYGSQEPLSPPPTLPTPTMSLPSPDCDQSHFGEMNSIDGSLSHHFYPADASHHYRLLSPPFSPELASVNMADVPYHTSTQSSLFFPHIARSPSFFIENDLQVSNDEEGQIFPNVFQTSLNSQKTVEDVHMALWDCLSIDSPMSSSAPVWQLADLDDFSHTFFPPPGSPLISSPASSDHDYDIHDYEEDFMSPPSSPSLRPFSDLPLLEDEDESDNHLRLSNSYEDRQIDDSMSSSSSKDGYNTERVPSIRSFPGVETDEDLIPADLASRSWVPENCIVIPSPYITPSTLIPFPESTGLNGSRPKGGAMARNNSLLLVDHHGASSPFLSSSSRIGAELDLLDPALVASDVELKRLLDMRRRALASERQARMVEAQYKTIKTFPLRDVDSIGSGITDDGTSVVDEEGGRLIQSHLEEARMQALLAMQAKGTRKREREKAKEISTLVKIKLTERGVSFKKASPYSYATQIRNEDLDLDGIYCPTDGFLQDSEIDDTAMIDHTDRCGHRVKSNKGTVTTIPQLVSRMILRRREARLRPLARPRLEYMGTTPPEASRDLGSRRYTGQSYRKSPLAFPVSTDVDETMVVHSKHFESQYSSLHWHMDVDCHTCPDSAISLDDLDIGSKFDLLSLSTT
ncbi:hypothetical protein APHAL10511_007187 [Amanita phalloides]|nr:hypothetical protein APHAL10511_007187 [Amanita phalloides]